MLLVFILPGLYPTAEAFFICLAVNLLVCNVAVSFGKMKEILLCVLLETGYCRLSMSNFFYKLKLMYISERDSDGN